MPLLDSRIVPDNIPSFTQRQSKYPQLKGKLPCRVCMFGKSSAGKGVACVNLLTKFFVDESEKPCFHRYMIVSPTANLDHGWKPVRKFMQDRMGLSEQKVDSLFLDTWDQPRIQAEIDAHSEIVQGEKKAGKKELSALLIVFDDMADQGGVMHKNNDSLINRLYLSGRHRGISSIVISQKKRLIAPTIVVQCNWLMAFRTSDRDELESIYAMFSALIDRPTFDEVWRFVHKAPYSFLTVFPNEMDADKIFMHRLEEWITFENEV